MKKNYQELFMVVVTMAEDAIRTSGDNMLEDVWDDTNSFIS